MGWRFENWWHYEIFDQWTFWRTKSCLDIEIGDSRTKPSDIGHFRVRFGTIVVLGQVVSNSNMQSVFGLFNSMIHVDFYQFLNRNNIKARLILNFKPVSGIHGPQVGCPHERFFAINSGIPEDIIGRFRAHDRTTVVHGAMIFFIPIISLTSEFASSWKHPQIINFANWFE